MRKPFFLAVAVGMMTTAVSANDAVGSFDPESIPEVAGRAYMLPSKTIGVKTPVISLNGRWDFKYDLRSSWKSIEVPGEAAMQGYAIKHDKGFFYRKRITLPSDFAGQRVILRFDGVYSHAKLSVNGHFVREHHGGFTRWETDITEYVRPGKKVEISLEVEDRIDEISYAAGYAHHPIGGILRDVTLFAIPESHLYDVSFETPLDAGYARGKLHMNFGFEDASPLITDEVRVTLKSPKGKQNDVISASFSLKQGKNVFDMDVQNPILWDGEHPNLYTAEVTLMKDGEPVNSFTRMIGFREVKVVKDRMYVNGRQVKLRGACRHDVHPTMGRSTNRMLDSLDVMRFKESNMNFVRTSHYAPSENFLELCDRYGIYVESETPVCFINTHRQKNFAPGATQDDPAFTDRYLGQLQEMVKSHRSHASVLFWSIGNESVYGRNFQLSYDWVKEADKTRPVIFSYPGTAKEKNAKVYDLLSMHYQDVNGDLWQVGMQTRGYQGEGLPAIFDEWAHPACYTYSTLQTDPNIREFWGKSIDMMWDGVFRAPGGLGGAIWCYSDETFSLPKPKVGTPFWKEFHHTAKPEGFRGDCVGYGEWGIVDVWRRVKPEFWATKKAYSPVRIMTAQQLDAADGKSLGQPLTQPIAYIPEQPIYLTVYNRFNHTNLNEVQACYIYKGHRTSITMPSVEPHQKGLLTLAAASWTDGEKVRVEFIDAEGHLIDAEELILGSERIDYPKPLVGSTLQTTEDGHYLVVRGNRFEIPFNKETGLIENAKVGDEVILKKGPFVNLYINLNHLTGAEVRKKANFYATAESDWKMTSLNVEKDSQSVMVKVCGTYQEAEVDYTVRVLAHGELSISYHVKGAPNGYLRETGLAFHLPATLENLNWHRRGYWSCYPEDAMSGIKDSVNFYASKQVGYAQQPVQSWRDDNREYYYLSDRGANCDRPLTRVAKSMKENIYYYTLTSNQSHGFSVLSKDASVSCRMNTRPDSEVVLYTDNRWDYPEIAWGNYCKTLEAMPCYGEITLRLK